MLFRSDEIEIYNRKRPDLSKDPDEFLPYQLTDDLVPPMADYGSGFKYHTSGLFHDQSGFPDGKKETAKLMQDRLHNKLNNNLDQIIFYEKDIRSADKVAVLSYGSAARTAISAVNTGRKDNLKAGWFKLQTIWPFAEKAVAELAAQVETIIVPELNQGQLIREVKKAAAGRAKVLGINSYAGELIKPEEIRALLEEVL